MKHFFACGSAGWE